MTRIQTFNMKRKFFIRHHNWEGEINEIDRPGPIKDFDWNVIFLGMDNGFRLVAFEAVKPAGYFLRHKNFRLVLSPDDGTEQFKMDHTFRETAPLVGDPNEGWHSYQAFQQALSDRFIGHIDLHLYIRARSEDLMEFGDPKRIGDGSWRLV
ncbi:AbfB domain-containing protein [Streptomyces sp. NBC_01568]|uniref:AbfB domain-containing protein n=1 Tax=Streptomyces sp. NBC_01568 TaxID=2975882 RepID=UPI00386E0187